MPEERFIVRVTDKEGKQRQKAYDSEEGVVSEWGTITDAYGQNGNVEVWGPARIDKNDDNAISPDTEYTLYAKDKDGRVRHKTEPGSSLLSSREKYDKDYGADNWGIVPNEYRLMTPRYNAETNLLEGFDEWREPEQLTNAEAWDRDFGEQYRELEGRMNTPEYQRHINGEREEGYESMTPKDRMRADAESARIGKDIGEYQRMKREREDAAYTDRLERVAADDSSLDGILKRLEEVDGRIAEQNEVIARNSSDLDFNPDANSVAMAQAELVNLKRERDGILREADENGSYQAKLKLQKKGLENFDREISDIHHSQYEGGQTDMSVGYGQIYATKVPVRGKEGADRTGFSETPEEIEFYVTLAEDINNDTYRTLNLPNRGFHSGMADVFGNKGTYAFGIPDAVKNINSRGVIDKFMKDPDSLTKDENLVIEAWMRNADAHALQDPMRNSWFKGGQGFAQSVEFMIEMAITGGIVDAAEEGALRAALTSWAKKSGRRGATRWIEGQVSRGAARSFGEGFSKFATGKIGNAELRYAAEQGVNALRAIPRGTLQTALNVPMQMRSFGEQLLAFDEDGNLPSWNRALGMGEWHSWVETYTENGIEPIWNVLTRLPIRLAGIGMSKFLPGAYNNVMEMYTKARTSGFWRMMRAGGFQGINEEAGEELAGALLYAAAGEPEELHDFFTKDNLSTLYISFAPMGLIGAGGSMAQVGMSERHYRNMRNALDTKLRDMGFDKDQRALALDGILSDPVSGHLGLVESMYRQAVEEGAIVEGKDKDGKRTWDFAGEWKELDDSIREYRAAAAQKAMYDGAWASEQNARRRDDYRSLYGTAKGDFSYRGEYEAQGRTENTDGEGELAAVEEGERMGKELGTEEEKGDGRMSDAEAQRHINDDKVAVVQTTDGRTVYVLGRAENGEWAVRDTKGGEMTFIGDDQIQKGQTRGEDGNAREMTADETVRASVRSMRDYIDGRLLYGENQKRRAETARGKAQVRAARHVLIRGMMDELYPEQGEGEDKRRTGGRTFGPNGEYRVADQQQFTTDGLMVYRPGETKATMMTWDQIGKVLHGDNFSMPKEEDVDRRMSARNQAEKGELPTEEERQRNQSALDRIPKDKDGKPIFEQAESPSVAWDAMVERNGGNVQRAETMARGAAAAAKEEADKADRKARKAEERAERLQGKPKGKTFEEMMENQERADAEAQEARANAEAAKRNADFWQGVVNEIESRGNTETAQTQQQTTQQQQTQQTRQESEESRRRAEAAVEEMTGMTYGQIAETYGENVANFVRDLAAQAEKWNLPCRILMTEDDLKAECEKEGIGLPDGRVNGFAHNGKAYICVQSLFEYAENRADRERKGLMTLAHEGMAHIGMEAMMGSERYGKYCERVFGNLTDVGKRRWLKYQWKYNMGDKSKRDALGIRDGKAKAPAWEELTDEQVGMLMSGGNAAQVRARRGAADECVAGIAEKVFSGGRLSADERGVWEKVRDWFLRVFGGVLTERDIADRLRRVERKAERGKLFGERGGETKNEGTSFMAEERNTNSTGYYGDMSRRAVEAREKGRFPMYEFTKKYDIPEESVKLLRGLGVISGNEWHHEGADMHEERYYGWSERGGKDWAWEYSMHKDRIDELAKEYEAIPEVKEPKNGTKKEDYILRRIDYSNPDEFDEFDRLQRKYFYDYNRNESEEDRRRREEEFVSELEKAFPQLSESEEYKKHSAEVDRYDEKRAEERNRVKEVTGRVWEVLNEEIKPIGKGPNGDIYDQFRGKVKEAVEFLRKNQSGDLLGVFHRDDTGDIDLIWGDEGKGLCHIILKHVGPNRDFQSVNELVNTLIDVIGNGRIKRDGESKRVLDLNGFSVVVSRDYNGKQKNWIISAIDTNRSSEEKGIATSPTFASRDARGPEAAAPHNSEGKGSEKSGTSKESAENSRFSAEEREERQFEETRFMVAADLKNDPLMLNGYKKFKNEGMAKRLADAKDMEELNSVLNGMCDDLMEEYFKRKIEYSPKDAKRELMTLQRTDNNTAKALLRDQGIQYKEDGDYTDDEMKVLADPVSEKLTEYKKKVGEEWDEALDDYPPIAKYVAMKGIQSFMNKPSTKGSPVPFIKDAFDLTMSRFEQSGQPVNFNFYDEYNRAILDVVNEDENDRIEVHPENGVGGTWVKVHKASESEDAEKSKAKAAAASLGSNWCTRFPDQGCQKVIVNDNHDMYFFYPDGSTQAQIAVVPIRPGEEGQLRDNQWYTGVFKRDNGTDNSVPSAYFGAVNELAEKTKDTDLAHTLDAVGYGGMTEEERIALFRQNADRMRDIIDGHGIFTADDIDEIYRLFNIQLIQNGDRLALHEFNSGIYDGVKNAMIEAGMSEEEAIDCTNDFWAMMFDSIDEIEGSIDLDETRITDLGNVESIGGNLYIDIGQGYSEWSLRKLKRVDGGVYITNSDSYYRPLVDDEVNLLDNLEYVGSDLRINDIGIESLGAVKYVGGSLDLDGCTEITSFGGIEHIGGSIFLKFTGITSLEGIGKEIHGDLELSNSKVTSLGEVENVYGNLYASNSPLADLGKLKWVGKNAEFAYSKISSLGSLMGTGSDLNLNDTKVESLGELKSVGNDLKIKNTPITTLGGLRNIGGWLDTKDTALQSLGDLERVFSLYIRKDSKIQTLGNLKEARAVVIYNHSLTSLGSLEHVRSGIQFGADSSIPIEEQRKCLPMLGEKGELWLSNGEKLNAKGELLNEGETKFSAEERGNGNSGHEMTEAEQLERDNERYNSDLDAFSRGEGYSPVRVGTPSAVLRACGLNDTEMYIKRKVLRDHLNKHNLTIDDIRNLPKALQKPLLVYEWGNEAKSMVIITNMEHGDDRITVAVKVERGGEIVEVNEIASVHAKEASRFLSEMTNARRGGLREALRWVGDKEKALEWLGLTPSSPEEVGALTEQELSVAKVIQDFDNPTLPDENVNFSAEERRVENERVLSEVQGQKQPGASYDTADMDMDDLGDTRFSVGERRRTEMDNRLRKVRPDLTEEERDALFDYLGTLTKPNGDNDTKLQNATFNWFAKGAIRIPEDMDKVRQAVKVADMAKVDPMRYDSPMELIDENSEFKVKDKPINPDEVPVLRKVREYPDGITVYEFDDGYDGYGDYELPDDEEERLMEVRGWLRRIIDTHWGVDCNPWCLLQGDGKGNLTDDSRYYWGRYGRYGKRVAFKDGRLLAFFAAGQEDEPTWWDRQDRPHRGIPVTRAMNDGSGRVATYEYVEDMGAFNDNEDGYNIEEGSDDWEFWHPMNEWRDNWKEGWSGPLEMHRGNKQNGTYEEWHKNGELKLKANFKDGRLEGMQEAYYDNGRLQYRQEYRDGERNGLFEKWHPNGDPAERVEYKDNGINGLFEKWGETIDSYERINYVNNVKDGLYEFYIDGHIRERGEYKNGRKEGTWRLFWPNGHTQLQTSHKNGDYDGVFIARDEGGLMTKYDEFKDGKHDGLRVGFWNPGKIEFGEEYKDGAMVRRLSRDEAAAALAERGYNVKGEPTNVGETKFSAEERGYATDEEIADAGKRFDEELQRQIDGKLPKDHTYHLGNPGRILIAAGFPNIPIELKASQLRAKSEDESHPYDINEIKGLVEAINTPIATFEYGDKTKAQNIITTIRHSGKNFLVGVALNPIVKGRRLEINDIRNIFPKDNQEWVNWASQGKLTWVDKEKIQPIIAELRINPAEVSYLELDNAAKVIQDFDNPTLPSENSADFRASAEERELSDADTRETVSDIENPENDTRFSAEERVATADEARERFGVELTPDDLASTSTKHGAMMKALRIATENGAIPNMDSSAETSFFSDIFRNAPKEVRDAIQEAAFNGDYDIAGETGRTLANLVTDEVMGNELTDAQKTFLDGAAKTIADRLNISGDNAKYVLWQHVNADDGITTDAERLAMQNALGVTTPASDYEAGVQSEVRHSMAEESMGDSAAEYYEKSLESIAGALDEVYHNEYRALDKMVEAVLLQSGRPVDDWENPSYAYNQLSSRTKAALDAYMRDYFDPLRDTIADICKRHNLNVNDLIEYVSLKHGIERNRVFHQREWRRLQDEENKKAEREGREPRQIPEPKRDDYSGIMEWMKGHKELGEFDNIADAERAAQGLVDGYERNLGRDADGLWKSINAATRRSLSIQLTSGLLSREMYDQISSMFEYYVPFQGFSKDTKTNEDKYYYIDTWQEGHAGTIGKRAKGRKTKADNPFTRIGLNAQKAIVEAEKNRAKTALYLFLAERPNDLTAMGDVWYVKTNDVDDKGNAIWKVSAPTFGEGNSSERIAETLDRWRTRMLELEEKGEAVREENRFSLGSDVRFIFPKDVSQHCIDVAIDGHRERIYIKGNPRAAQAVNGLLSKRDGKLAQYVNAATRYCAAIYTSLNPQFFVTNFARDIGYAMANQTGKEGFGYAARFAGNAALAAQIGVLSHKYRHGNLNDDREMQRYYGEFAENGGITGYSQMQNDKYYTNYVNNALKRGKWMRDVLNAPLRAFRQVTEDGENLLRFAAYVTSRQMGRGVTESVANAKDATVNFNRRGTGRMITMEEAERLIPDNKIGQVMLCASSLLGACRPLWAFFNVAIQGMAQMVQNVVRHPFRTVGTTMVNYFGMGLMNGLIHGAAAGLFGGDPPDADDWYWNLSDWERRNNIIIPLGGGRYIKIPMAQELRVFYGMGDIVAGALAHKTAQKNILKEILGSIGDMLPVNTFGEGGVGQSIAPTFISPIVDIALNTDYRGMKIIPETYDGKKAKWRYAYSGTPDWAVAASRALNGWNKGTPGFIDVSPEAIQHLAEGYLGGIMTFAGMCYDTGKSIAKGEELNMRRVPFVNRFYGHTSDRATGSYLLEMNRYAKDIYGTAKVKLDDFRTAHDRKGREAYKKTKEYRIYRQYEKYGKRAADLAKEIAETEDENRRMEKIRRRNAELTKLADEMEKILYGQ